MISISYLFSEIDTSSLTSEQKSQYRKEMKAVHPDTGGSKEAFQQASAKWEKASSPQSSSGSATIHDLARHAEKTAEVFSGLSKIKQEIKERNERMEKAHRSVEDLREKIRKLMGQ
jgi:hypothetical protein